MPILANPRWEKFAQHVATGESATAAYRMVYAKAKNADVMGPRLLGNVGVRARVADLQARSATAATLTMQQRREIACVIALNTTARDSDRLAAIMVDARLAGELKPEATVNVGVTVQTPDALIAGLAKFLCAAQVRDTATRLPDAREIEAETIPA